MTVLVIDVGSSSVRAMLFNESARLIPGGLSSRKHQFQTAPDGTSTADPEQLRTYVESCVDDVLGHPATVSIQAVGMATFVSSMIGVDEADRAITPLYSYADTRCAADVQHLKGLLTDDTAYRETGCPLHTAYYPARLHWLSRTQPELFRRVASWMDIGTYLYRQWFQRPIPMSYSEASWTGALSLVPDVWAVDLLHQAGLVDVPLPELADYTAAQRGLAEPYARRWRILADKPFFLAIGDGAAANVGSGAASRERLALTVGTTAAVRRIVPRDLLDETLKQQGPGSRPWVYRLDADNYIVGGATYEGGNIFQWAQNTLKLDAVDIERALSKCPADGHGLTFLPHLSGERSPGWQADATGIITGIQLATTPLDLLQAALEGVAYRLAIIVDGLGEGAVMAGGGALVASLAWTQIMADAMNRPLHLIDEAEVSGRGVAMLLLRPLAELDEYPTMVRQIITPQPDRSAVLLKARNRQIALYDKLYG